MKLKDGFVTYESDGEQIMVSAGSVSFAGLARSNQTAAFIVNCLKEETSVDEITAKMAAVYDAPEEVIRQDVMEIIDKLRGIHAIEE